jgi:septum formation protein
LKSSKKIILASESQRRKDLLMQIGIKKFLSVKHDIDEKKILLDPPITKSIVELAFMKANSVRQKLDKPKKIIIAGDTIVFRAGRVFEKTGCKEKVKEYLKLLSARRHFVYGGLCVISDDGRIFKRLIITEVYFNKISENDISDEILEDGIGKAGGYAIQSFSARFVRKIRGCYTNIVGISIPELYKILKILEF